MDVIRRRALIGWVAGAAIIVGLFVWAVVSRPTVEGASAAIVSRFGLVSAIAVLPLLLTVLTMSKFTADNAVAAVLLPVFLALGLGVVVVMLGFTPEDARVCAGLQHYDINNPACFTTTSTRLRMLAEGLMAWAAFGLLLAGAFKLRERRKLRAVRV